LVLKDENPITIENPITQHGPTALVNPEKGMG